MKKNSEPKLYEYRIKYNATKEVLASDNYHYFMAKDANEAFDAHMLMLKKNKLEVQNISIEKFNPYSSRWEDETLIVLEEKQDEG